MDFLQDVRYTQWWNVYTLWGSVKQCVLGKTVKQKTVLSAWKNCNSFLEASWGIGECSINIFLL